MSKHNIKPGDKVRYLNSEYPHLHVIEVHRTKLLALFTIDEWCLVEIADGRRFTRDISCFTKICDNTEPKIVISKPPPLTKMWP